MAHNNETICLVWCDPGTVDALFTVTAVTAFARAEEVGYPLVDFLRAFGNQIGKQRQQIMDTWYDTTNHDWMLWIDSDIVATPEDIKMLWDAADKDIAPIVTGIYFISQEPEKSMMKPMPAIFTEADDGLLKHETNLTGGIEPIDVAGMGFVLIHRSVVTRLRKAFPGVSVFIEEKEAGKRFQGEDVKFFRHVKKAGIPVFAHTGVFVKHMKRFVYDVDFYRFFWGDLANKKEI
jgi:hypothetical protein